MEYGLWLLRLITGFIGLDIIELWFGITIVICLFGIVNRLIHV